MKIQLRCEENSEAIIMAICLLEFHKRLFLVKKTYV